MSRVLRYASLPTLAASAIALGHALQLRNGFYAPDAIRWLAGAFVLALAGVATLRTATPSTTGARILRVVVLMGLGWQVFELARWWPGMYIPRTVPRSAFRAGVAVEAALVAAAAFNVGVVRRLWFPAILVTHVALGVWTLRMSPAPAIDVVLVHDAAIDALERGRSPYDVQFANLYGPDTTRYPRDRIVGTQVRWGYPYPPLTLLLAVPFKALFGDYRYMLLAAQIAAALLIGYTRPGLTPKLVAALLLTQPRGFFVLEQGWTEPVAVGLLAATTACLVRSPVGAAWSTGWLLITKQYLVFVAPVFARFVWRSPHRVRLVLVASIAAAVVTIPFFVQDPRGFSQFVFLQQGQEPFRSDALSFLSWAARRGWGEGSMAWAVGAGLVTLVVAWRRTPNTAAGLAAGVALSTFAAFAFGSKAFCNYYYFVIGALCCVIASSEVVSDGTHAG